MLKIPYYASNPSLYVEHFHLTDYSLISNHRLRCATTIKNSELLRRYERYTAQTLQLPGRGTYFPTNLPNTSVPTFSTGHSSKKYLGTVLVAHVRKQTQDTPDFVFSPAQYPCWLAGLPIGFGLIDSKQAKSGFPWPVSSALLKFHACN